MRYVVKSLGQTKKLLYTQIRGRTDYRPSAPENRLPNRAVSLGAVTFFAVAAVRSSDPHGGTQLNKSLFDALFGAFPESASCVDRLSDILPIDSCKDDLEKGAMDVGELIENNHKNLIISEFTSCGFNQKFLSVSMIRKGLLGNSRRNESQAVVFRIHRSD